MARSAVKLGPVCAMLVFAVLHTGNAQPATLAQVATCECMKKQLADNCRGICACLVRQNQPVGDQKTCELVCNSCDMEFKSKGCPTDGRLPAACLRPATFTNAVQKCDAVANRQCSPPAGQKVQAEKGPMGRKLFF